MLEFVKVAAPPVGHRERRVDLLGFYQAREDEDVPLRAGRDLPRDGYRLRLSDGIERQ